MAIQRLQIAKNKKKILSKHTKREISQLLLQKKEELARIKTEHIVREDFQIEAYEILELLCELLSERIRLITNCDCKSPPEDLVEAMTSIIWASERVTIEEFNEVRNQLRKKFGSQFIKNALSDANEKINSRLMKKLVISAPSATLVTRYLEEIAKENKIDWTPTNIDLPENSTQPYGAPTGFSIPMAPGNF